MQDLITNNSQVYSFEAPVKMSAFQPIDVRPVYGRKWVTNGPDNKNYKTYKDAYEDSPTNMSIINAYVSYLFGEGIIDVNGKVEKDESGKIISDTRFSNVNEFVSQQDVLLMCQDLKIYGGFCYQVIWSNEGKPLMIKYTPVYKFGVNYNQETIEIDGFWYSYDWTDRYRFRPTLYPKYTGDYNNEPVEVDMVRRPTSETFFPVPDYLAGIPWAHVEGEQANAAKNHFKNAMSDITVINYNNGRQATPQLAESEARKVREKVVGTENQSSVIVSFNESAESAVVVDRISPPEINQQNVFYAEEAEKKLIVAHSAPPILFSGTNQGSGFSSNADEMAVATKALYRRHINPMRSIILEPLQKVFKKFNPEIKLDFKDFEEEKKLEQNENV